jgi:uncharacterized membrane protein HdeD (DUF308 family)
MSPTAPQGDVRARLQRSWWLFLALGVVSIIFGILVIGAPYVMTSITVILIGVLLLILGVMEVIHALTVRNLRGFAVHLLTAGLYLVVGLFVLEDPDRAAAVFTLLLAAAFFVGGMLRIIAAIAEQFPAWQWVLLHGAVDLVLGVLIWSGWPESSNWVIGLFVGVDLLFHGWSMVILGLSVRPRAAGPAA